VCKVGLSKSVVRIWNSKRGVELSCVWIGLDLGIRFILIACDVVPWKPTSGPPWLEIQTWIHESPIQVLTWMTKPSPQAKKKKLESFDRTVR
jgi:hypothetical protein